MVVVVAAAGGEFEVERVVAVAGYDWWTRVLAAERAATAADGRLARAALLGVVRMAGESLLGGRVGFTAEASAIADRLLADDPRTHEVTGGEPPGGLLRRAS